MVKINVIQTGSTYVSHAVPDRSVSRWPLSYTGLFVSKKNHITVPVKAFLIETNDKKVLIDTGWSVDCATNPKEHLGFGLNFASAPIIKEEEGMENQLMRLGVKAEELDAVILTHMDCDHASGLKDVIGCKNVFASKQEIDAAAKGGARYNKNFWKDIEIKPLTFSDDEEAPFGKSCDYLEDGSLMFYFTPGHSAGEIAVVLNAGEKKYVFSGDNGYNRASWEGKKLPGPVENMEQMKKSVDWLHQMYMDGAVILSAHDPEVEQQTIIIE